MNVARYFLATLLVGIFIAMFDLLWYGRFLMEFYTSTHAIWRPQVEMNTFYPYIITNFIASALLITFSFALIHKNNNIKEGICFGMIIGLFIALREFQIYPYLPVPLKMALYWALGGVIMGLGSGIICSLVYRKNVVTQ